METPNISQPPAPDQRKRGPWLQMAIVFVSAIILGGSSCAAMASAYQTGHDNLFALALIGFITGLVTIPCVIVWAIVALILKLVRKRGAQV